MNILQKYFAFYKEIINIEYPVNINRLSYAKFLIFFVFNLFIISVFYFLNNIFIEKYSEESILFTIIVLCLLFYNLSIFYLISLKRFINGAIPLIFLFIIPFFILIIISLINQNTNSFTFFNSSLNDSTILLIIFGIYNLFIITICLTVPERKYCQNNIINNKSINYFIIKPINNIVTFNLNSVISKKQYFISLFTLNLTIPLLFYLAYHFIIMLRYIYRNYFNMQFYGNDFGFEMLLFLLAIVITALTTSIGSIILYINILNNITKNKIIRITAVLSYIIIFITILIYTFSILENINVIICFLIYTIYFMLPAIFKIKNKDKHNS